MESISALRERCQSSKQAGDFPSPYVRFGRKYSIYLTWVLLHTRMSANQVTLLGIGLGLLGACLLAFNRPLPLITGLVLLQISFILDFSDGEVARYKNATGTLAGAYLDYLYHFYVPILYMGGLAISAFTAVPRLEIFALGVLACAGVSQMHFFCKEHILISHLRNHPEGASRPEVLEAMQDSPRLGGANVVSSEPANRFSVSRLTRFIGELLLYPYAFNVISAVVLLDIWLSQGQAVTSARARIGFLAVAACLLLLQTFKKVRSNFLVLRAIDRS